MSCSFEKRDLRAWNICGGGLGTQQSAVSTQPKPKTTAKAKDEHGLHGFNGSDG
jgi:hypothetical protein